jgi:hypothetical protein
VNNISTDGDSISLTYRDGKVATLGDLDGLVKKIADCEDVEITDLQDGHSLVYDADSEKWVNSHLGYDAPVIYSLEEREVGVWTDGKPLYQKTWILNYTAHTTAEHNTSIDIHDLNVEVPVAIEGFWRRWAGDGNKLYYHWGSEEPTYGQSWARVDSENNYTNGRLEISIISDGTDYQQITLRYTKTTDTPGSGKWTTMGVPAHHYSTEEQVVGTWIDGSTIYEKSFEITLPSSYDASGGFLIENDATYINAIISFNGTVKATNELIVGSGIDASGLKFSIHRNPDSQLLLYTSNDGANMYGGTAYITIQYTKTTPTLLMQSTPTEESTPADESESTDENR